MLQYLLWEENIVLVTYFRISKTTPKILKHGLNTYSPKQITKHNLFSWHLVYLTLWDTALRMRNARRLSWRRIKLCRHRKLVTYKEKIIFVRHWLRSMGFVVHQRVVQIVISNNNNNINISVKKYLRTNCYYNLFVQFGRHRNENSGKINLNIYKQKIRLKSLN